MLRRVIAGVGVGVLCVVAVSCANGDDRPDVVNDATSRGGATSSSAAAPGVQGVVTDAATGAPVAGALVVPSSVDPDGPAVPEIAVRTDGQGRYTWSLPPGRWEISVRADGFADARGAVRVEPGKLATLDLELHSTR